MTQSCLLSALQSEPFSSPALLELDSQFDSGGAYDSCAASGGQSSTDAASCCTGGSPNARAVSGRFRITELTAEPRQVILSRRYQQEIARNVACGSRLKGQIFHQIMQQHVSPAGGLSEETFEADLACGENRFTVVGRIDHYDPLSGTLTDYKYARTASYSKYDTSPWYEQLLNYAWYLQQAGWPVRRLSCVVYFHDYHEVCGRQNAGDLPPQEFMRFSWDIGAAELRDLITGRKEIIYRRCCLLQSLAAVPEENLPPCADIWPDRRYAWRKEGRKTAVRSLTSAREALVWAAEQNAPADQAGQTSQAIQAGQSSQTCQAILPSQTGQAETSNPAGRPEPAAKPAAAAGLQLYLETRSLRRCERYCDVKDWCSQYQKAASLPAEQPILQL